ncbi:MAG: NAD(P)H-hydrate dehydratase [Acidobacteria bacterium]|nr:MAG: NAD(P)H-hydrate dehydratase [Acidobacteriota bacterium]
MKVLTAEQMREIDRLSTREYGVPSLLLMENAGLNLYLELERRFANLKRLRVGIICGKGNNGGDGMVLARQLVARGNTPDVVLLAQASQVGGDARVQLEILQKSQLEVREIPTEEAWRPFADNLRRYDIIVDAILGTGLTKPLDGFYRRVAEDVNNSGAFVLAVDIPSGMPSDSSLGGSPCIRANLTVTFTAPKIAHVLNQDQESLGEVVVAPIGSPPQLLEDPNIYLQLMQEEEIVLHRLPRRIASHKGDFGHVVLLAGSRGKSGAALLSARAALNTGAGLVTAAVPETVQPIVAAGQAEVMTEPLAATEEGTVAETAADQALALLKGKDAAGLGPGLSRNSQSVWFIRQLVRKCPIPLVIDADGLNAFEDQADLIRNDHDQPLVLTPHPGEFSRLIGVKVREMQEDAPGAARRFAQERRLWLVLKGFRTLVADPGGTVYVCPRGNQGMATGGTGDVLTGVLTALLGSYCAQKQITPEHVTRAVVLGVYLHALAGDLAAAAKGPEALTAGDIIAHLGQAYRKLAIS